MKRFFIVLALLLGAITFVTIRSFPQNWELALLGSMIVYGTIEHFCVEYERQYCYYAIPSTHAVGYFALGGTTFVGLIYVGQQLLMVLETLIYQ